MEKYYSMKRSEMIELIENELQEIIHNLEFKSPNDFKFFKRSASGLLDTIEGLGMLPPAHGKFHQESGTLEINEWELE